jgi:hypothetical protein
MLKALVVSLVIIVAVVLYIVLGSGTKSTPTPTPTPTPTQACLDEQHLCNDGDSCCEGLACLKISGRTQKACMKTWDCETDACYVNQRKWCDKDGKCVIKDDIQSSYVCSNGEDTCTSYPIQNDSGGVDVYCMDRGNAFRYIPPTCKKMAEPNV